MPGKFIWLFLPLMFNLFWRLDLVRMDRRMYCYCRKHISSCDYQLPISIIISYLNYFSGFGENGLITYYPIYYFIVELNQNIILKDCDSFIEVINLVVRLNFQFLEILNLFDYLNLVFTNDFRLIDCLVTYHNYV